MKTCTTLTILLAMAATLLSPALAVNGRDLQALVLNSNRDQQLSRSGSDATTTLKIRMDAIDDEPAVRSLQQNDVNLEDAACYTTTLDGTQKSSSRYCTVDNTPRKDTFLILACPEFNKAESDYSKCACAIGIGNPEEAPDTETCVQCNVCKDQSLAYDCRNVADGTCIGYNCNGECISSREQEEDLELTDESSAVTTHANWNSARGVGIVALATSLVGFLL
jgi:hypothetical protein